MIGNIIKTFFVIVIMATCIYILTLSCSILFSGCGGEDPPGKYIGDVEFGMVNCDDVTSSVTSLQDVTNNKAPALLFYHTGWCGPCQAEEGVIAYLQEKNKDVKIVSILMQDEYHNKSDEYLIPASCKNTKAIKAGVIPAIPSSFSRFNELCTAGLIPCNVFVDSGGHIEYVLDGYDYWTLSSMLSGVR